MEDAMQETGHVQPKTQLGQPHYVLDAGVLEVYPEIIPDENDERPEHPSVDLSNAHLIVTTDTIQWLNGSHHDRALVALRRLRHLLENKVEGPNSSTPSNHYTHGATATTQSETDIVTVECGGITVSVVPTSGDFAELLAVAENHGWQSPITLLTNNDARAIQARSQGLLTSSYQHLLPQPYTGRRDLVVPNSIFTEFWYADQISREQFESWLPSQPQLMPNEFVVLLPECLPALCFAHDVIEDPYFHYIMRYDAESDQLVHLQYLSDFQHSLANPGQAMYAEALAHPDIAAVICTGPAGSGKTYMATVYCYDACQAGQYIGATVVPCESRSNLGALPGDLDEKMDPSVQPMKNALRNFLMERSDYRRELQNLAKFGANSASGGKEGRKPPIRSRLDDHVEQIWSNWFTSVPIEVARGRDFAREIAIYDEAQDQSPMQMDTLIKRLGDRGKIIITGDIDQIHNPDLTRTNNGLTYASQILGDSKMVAEVRFTPDEVVRHPLVREVAEKQAAV